MVVRLIDPVTVARSIAPDGDAEKASFIYYRRAAADTAVKQIVLLFHAAGYTNESVWTLLNGLRIMRKE